MKRKRHQSRAQKQSVPLLTAAAIVLGAPALTAAPFCVFRDTNNNGVQDTGETGIPMVTVTAFDAMNTQIAQVMTIADGSYDLGLSTGTDVRLEFSNFPAPFISGTSATSAATVITNTDDGYSLALIRPADACETNPVTFTPCYISGDPSIASVAAGDAVVAFRFEDTGTSTANKKMLANTGEVGATWGAAHDRVRDRAYVASVIRRHTSLGPGMDGTFGTSDDVGTIYSIDITDLDNPVVTPFVEIPGTNPNSLALDNTSRGIAGDTGGQPSADAGGYAGVGRAGLGDIDITDDNSTLYAVNLGTQSLVPVDLTGASPVVGTAINIYNNVTLSGTCAETEFRPWAVKVLGTEVYVGAVCSGESGGALRSYILKLNVAGTGFDEVFSNLIPLSGRDHAWFRTSFPGGSSATPATFNAAMLAASQWKPWLSAATSSWPATTAQHPFGNGNPGIEDYIVHAQPILSDIEFDTDGSLILGYNDRMAMVGGFLNVEPDGTGNASFIVIGAGDIVRVCNPTSGLALEGTANCPFPNTGENEYYFGDVWNNGSYDEHQETAFGSLAVKPDSSEVMVTVFDPRDGAGNFNSGGVRRLDNATGAVNASFELYDGTSRGTTFAKAAGLGDLEIACELPIVLGNRFFDDTNKNGRQDPGEPGIPGVVLEVYGPGDTMGSPRETITTTDSPTDDPAIEGTWVTSPVDENTTYCIVVADSNFLASGPLFAKEPTNANAPGVADNIDSELTIITGQTGSLSAFNGKPGVCVNSGTESNFDTDLGVQPASPVGVGNLVFQDNNLNGIYDGAPTDTPLNNITVELYLASETPGTDAPTDTDSTDSSGCYHLVAPQGGSYVVFIPGGQVGTLISSPGAGGDTNTDDDGDENGLDTPVAGGIVSAPIQLTSGGEPEDAIETGKTGNGDNAGLTNTVGSVSTVNDNDTDFTVDFSFVDPAALPGIGNLVWTEAGTPDGERYTLGQDTLAPNGTTLELFNVGDDPETATPVATATTTDGCYILRAAPGEYFVHIPKENFGAGLLGDVVSITGNGGDDASDDDTVGAADNGIDSVDPASTGISSTAITLTVGMEPDDTSETGKDGSGDTPDLNNDFTVDFGFTTPAQAPGTECFDIIEPAGGTAITGGNPPSGFVLERTFEVTDSCTVAEVAVGLAFETSNRTNIKVELVSPAGTVVDLVSGTLTFPPNDPDNLDVMLDDDNSRNPITGDNGTHNVSNNGTPANRYEVLRAPIGSLSDFDGQNGQGTWRMRFNRNGFGTVPNLLSAQLKIDCLSAAPKVGVGNLVFIESGANTGYQSGEDTPVKDVLLELVKDGSVVSTAVTNSGGCYSFVTDPGTGYLVRVAASNFSGMGVLAGVTGSVVDSGVAPTDSADGATQLDDDADENGIDPVPNDLAGLATAGISSGTFELAVGTEPDAADSESGKDSASDDAADSNNDLTIDFAFTAPSVTYGLGNLVFMDNNGDGNFDATGTTPDMGVDGVLVNVFDASDDTLAGMDTTVDGDFWKVDGLPAGTYYAVVDSTNFTATTGALEGKLSSPGAGADDGTDDTTDENGIDDSAPATNGIRSGDIVLGGDPEPTGETGAVDSVDPSTTPDDRFDSTVDFSFFVPVAVGNLVFCDEDADGNYDPTGGDTGVSGVTVSVYRTGEDPTDSLVIPSGTTTTVTDGLWEVGGLQPGVEYFAYIPGDEFTTGGALEGKSSTTGNGTDTTTDDTGTGGDENGIDIPNGDGGISSTPFVLTAGMEPENESGSTGPSGGNPIDENTNHTIDFAFTSDKAVTFAAFVAGNSEEFNLDDNTVPGVPGGTSGSVDTNMDDLDTTPAADPDMDGRSNLEEFAFCLKPDSGLNGTAVDGGDSTYPGFCIVGTASEIEGTFLRPEGVSGLTYRLQYAAVLDTPAVPGVLSSPTPTTWTDIVLGAGNTTVASQGDGTELVTIDDIETLTGLVTGTGFVRVLVTLDSPAETAATKPQGWQTSSILTECQTFSYPFEDKQVYGGKGSVLATNLLTLDPTTLASGDDVTTAFDVGADYYIEVTDGDNIGHRFDIDEANSTATALALLTDGILCGGTDKSTQLSVPADLVGDMFVIRRYHTIDELFPPADYLAGADSDAGANLLFFDQIAQVFTTYFLLEDGAVDKWTVVGSTDDRGGDCIAPGEGLFTHNKGTEPAIILLQIGEVRCNATVQPLKAGYNLVGNAYPVTTSPDTIGMNETANGYTGTDDPDTADQALTWLGDATPGAVGYTGLFYLIHDDGINPLIEQWNGVSDATLDRPLRATGLLEGDRSIILDTNADDPI